MSDHAIEHTIRQGDAEETFRIEGIDDLSAATELYREVMDTDAWGCTCGPDQACDYCGGKKSDLTDVSRDLAARGQR